MCMEEGLLQEKHFIHFYFFFLVSKRLNVQAP